MYTVYEHVSPNGKRYVGITKQSLDRRFGHNGIQYKTSNRYFWNAIQKYGWGNFQHNIIAANLSHEEACLIEKSEIAKDKAVNNSYNITDGGDGRTGTTHSPETRAKISASKTGKKTCRDYSYMSPETRAKISATLTGYKQSDATCKKCSEHARGRKWIHKDGELKFVKSHELESYLSDGWVFGIGRPKIHSTETRQKLSKSRKGKKMPLEAVQRIAAKLRTLPPYCWVHNDHQNTRIPVSNLEQYLNNGWVRGRKDGGTK